VYSDRNARADLDDMEPQPYRYGLLGQVNPRVASPPNSPPGSPPFNAASIQDRRPTSFVSTGYQGLGTNVGESSRPHTSSSSAQPLVARHTSASPSVASSMYERPLSAASFNPYTDPSISAGVMQEQRGALQIANLPDDNVGALANVKSKDGAPMQRTQRSVLVHQDSTTAGGSRPSTSSAPTPPILTHDVSNQTGEAPPPAYSES